VGTNTLANKTAIM